MNDLIRTFMVAALLNMRAAVAQTAVPSSHQCLQVNDNGAARPRCKRDESTEARLRNLRRDEASRANQASSGSRASAVWGPADCRPQRG